MTEKIDIFGSTGFIGTRFCELFQSDVNVISRDSNTPTGNNDILYLISTTDNYNVLNDLHIDINTNLNKLMDVLENCKHKDIVFNFVSSWFVYGNCQLPAKETECCKPRGFYSITKKTAEDLLISFCNTFGVKYRIFRLGNVYGIGDLKKSKKKNALQYLIDEMKDGRDINLYHGGKFIRDYIHVNDVCRAIKLCMSSSSTNEIINIGSGYPHKFIDIINMVSKQIGYKGKINSMEPTEFHKIVQVKDFYLNVDKLNTLGFKQQISIEDGIKKLL